MHERIAAAALSSIDVGRLMTQAAALAAGHYRTHNELGSLREGNMARGFKTAQALDFKAQLLTDAAPRGFDALAWRDDLHMIKQPSPGQPTTRILLRDGGWCEIDGAGRMVRTWGTRGRADALAAALAEAGDWETRRLERTTTIARSSDAPRRERLTETQAEALVHWWQDRGYSATAAPDGCWVQAGTSRIRDTGDHMEIHGPVSDEAIRAAVIKAKEAWGGAAELTGRWSQQDQDRIWIESQRQGVQLENCKPSDAVRRMWEREQATAEVHTQTMSLVRIGTREAESVRAAAQGDPAGLGRLPPELRTFVTSYLDDDQRAELAASDVADIVPELSRFRALGREEVAEIERRNAESSRSTLPAPRKSDPRPATSDLAPVLE
ncbi:LPD7 domain-containing protein [Microvirga sp. M2]|uniref:LPD7 domain-containing protein n=1 Tax=Microvirga sp. M2 TaxID=3073270 RepID=UPI0039C37102